MMRKQLFKNVITAVAVILSLRGDANKESQEITLSSVNYIGKEVFSIPWLGGFVSSVLTIRWIVWIIAATFIILACLPAKSNLSPCNPAMQKAKHKP